MQVLKLSTIPRSHIATRTVIVMVGCCRDLHIDNFPLLPGLLKASVECPEGRTAEPIRGDTNSSPLGDARLNTDQEKVVRVRIP